MRTLIAVALLAGAGLSARAQAPCSDLSRADCRDIFINANLPVLSPTNPSPGALQPIQDALNKANAAAAQEKKIADDIDDMEMVLAGEKTRDSRLPAASVENILAGRRSLADAVKQKYASRNEAIELTVHIYGLTPGIVTAPPHPSGMPGEIVVKPWNPRYSENQALDENGHGRLLNDEEKRALASKAGLPPGSMMDNDGGTNRNTAAIAMFPHAFERPELLAAQILHETRHWLSLAALGRIESPSESYITDQSAYTLVADNNASFGLKQSDVVSMRNMASRYANQAALAPTLTWGQVEAHHAEWLHSASPVLDEAAATPGRPEPAKERAELGFLDSWGQGTAPIGASLKASHEAQEAQRLAREEDARRVAESARLEQERLAFESRPATRDELEREAARCGYRLDLRSREDDTIIGFKDGDSLHYFASRTPASLQRRDVASVFLVARACDSVRNNLQASGACNDSASSLGARGRTEDFAAQLGYMLVDNSHYDNSCVQEMIANSWRFTNTAAFEKFVAEYQASQIKRRKEEDKKRAKENKRSERRSAPVEKEPRNDGGKVPPEQSHDPARRRAEKVMGL